MKSWSLKELERNLSAWDQVIGAQLQKVVYHPKKIFFLEFYKQGNILVFIDLRRPNCFAGILPGLRAPKKVKKDTPASLFLRSRFEDKELKLVELLSNFGRVLRFHFGEELYFETRLFGADINLLAKDHEKKVSYLKPKDLVEIEDNYEPPEYRDLLEASKQWWDEFHGSSKSAGRSDPSDNLELWKKKNLKKKNTELDKAAKQLEKIDSQDYQLVGQSLLATAGQSYNELEQSIQKSIEANSWQESAQNAFALAKKNESKKVGLLQRMEDLKKELQQIDQASEVPKARTAKGQSGSKDLQKITGAKTKSKNISDDLRIHIGRSAKENVALLRKAKPWYLWMHIRDIPGNHLIVEKNKSRQMTEQEIKQAALELVNFSKKGIAQASFEVQYSECRYIKPIKGDKLGRVKVTQDNSLLVKTGE